MDSKLLIVIIGAAAAAIAAGLAVYVYTNQQNIQAQHDTSRAERCTAMVQSFAQRAQNAVNSGQYTYEQWRDIFDPEVEQLNRQCPEQMQGQ